MIQGAIIPGSRHGETFWHMADMVFFLLLLPATLDSRAAKF